MSIFTRAEQKIMMRNMKKGYRAKQIGEKERAFEPWLLVWLMLKNRLRERGKTLTSFNEEWEEEGELAQWLEDALDLFDRTDPEVAKQIAREAAELGIQEDSRLGERIRELLSSDEADPPESKGQAQQNPDHEAKNEIFDLQRKLAEAINTDVDHNHKKDR
ncbi:hypothetical protein [Salisediminibacterium selenitireducens]|uniref:Uncharacterized protein n=1 Tax=Bacillus selenitireducens (strain ATCC 700615 / DSM 15326 / MLS10) TaxID=439292 RepID=D6XX67_BACIE|nr:hypothetical protein [Salisediminibacterium selenitireducens]ADH97924.1 hypothetical protein Bsel_0384 [[Bacillus] selenitireducens MLS10]